MRDSLELTRVIGDVLDPFNKSVPMRVMYNRRVVVTGSEFRPSAVEVEPVVQIGGDDVNNFYTLVMVDPDAPNPSEPTLREYLHWMVTDIPAARDATCGNVAVCYENPRPVYGIHRFVFVLFQQLGMNTVEQPLLRQCFKTREFAELNNLGSPVAASFFNCQRESASGRRSFT